MQGEPLDVSHGATELSLEAGSLGWFASYPIRIDASAPAL